VTVRILVFLVLMAAVPRALEAQVGHDPVRSPYRDIGGSTFLTVSSGYFFGDGGKIGVVPHDGPTYGLHLNLLGNKPLQINVGVIYGDLSRNLVDPSKSDLPQQISTGVLWIDAAFQFNLTGNKTWHGLAPYVGSATGLAFTETVAGDPFHMGTRFVLSPMVGTRYFLGRSVSLMVEARFQFWQVNYPTVYIGNYYLAAHEWILTPWVRAGLGFPTPF
jgi:hypothetical protein